MMYHKAPQTNVQNARNKTADILGVDNHRPSVLCLFVYPDLKTIVQTTVNHQWLDNLDAACTLSRSAAYINRQCAPDLLALYVDDEETAAGCYVENSRLLKRNAVIVGMADDSGDTFCGVDYRNINFSWVKDDMS